MSAGARPQRRVARGLLSLVGLAVGLGACAADPSVDTWIPSDAPADARGPTPPFPPPKSAEIWGAQTPIWPLERTSYDAQIIWAFGILQVGVAERDQDLADCAAAEWTAWRGAGELVRAADPGAIFGPNVVSYVRRAASDAAEGVAERAIDPDRLIAPSDAAAPGCVRRRRSIG